MKESETMEGERAVVARESKDRRGGRKRGKGERERKGGRKRM